MINCHRDKPIADGRERKRQRHTLRRFNN
jgi:hypothetical protein